MHINQGDKREKKVKKNKIKKSLSLDFTQHQVRKPSPWEFHQYHERPYPKLVVTLHAIIVLWPFKVISVVCHM